MVVCVYFYTIKLNTLTQKNCSRHFSTKKRPLDTKILDGDVEVLSCALFKKSIRSIDSNYSLNVLFILVLVFGEA